ncbi:MAG: LysM peptidoglycan-binding domain-containing protein [Anaerolineales bacterium]|nr:LysM peptidoglycan-binding domain-containing protein [Anaerolineales bacterium]
MKKPYRTLVLFPVLFALTLPFATPHVRPPSLPQFQEASPTSEQETATPSPAPLTPADLINAVNTLRLVSGLSPLNAHPVLMQVAQTEASGIANGMPGHWRPNGLTLGQWLLSLGYPLSGDLSMDGYRSENWFYVSTSTTVDEIITNWQGDAEHRETMFSEFRSDIGAGIAVSPEGEVVAVLETALQTRSGLMQYGASDILTGIVQTQAAYHSIETLAATNGLLPEYSVPVAINTARPDGDVIHEVKYGQTLWTLAEMYKVPIDQIKRLNGLVDDNLIPGWKLLIQKAATQPPPVTGDPLTVFSAHTPTETQYPTAIPYHTTTPTLTPNVPSVPLGEQMKQNSTVVAALLIAFSVLIAGIIGFGRKREN